MKEKEYISTVNLYTTPIYRFLYKTYKDPSVCEDLVQESFLKLWNNRKKISENKAKSWLYTTAYRSLIDYIRKSKNIQELPENFVLIERENSSSDADVKEVVHLYLDELPLKFKSLILLRDIEGYSYEEIGEILDLELSNVKVNLFRARKKLKELIQKHESWVTK